MDFVWYFLIHVSLGMIFYEEFTFTNLGAVYATLAGMVVQSYPTYQLHRIAKPKFDAAFVGAPGSARHKEAVKQYWIRIGRLFVFRVSIYTILTLVVAAVVRGARAT
jgi:hypothetical protein